jgi:hypothetical protein
MTALKPYKHSEQKYCTPECHDQLEICYEYSQLIGGEYPANKLANKAVKEGTWKQEVVALLVARCCYCSLPFIKCAYIHLQGEQFQNEQV